METRARYVLIGFFTLFVLLAGFAFIYWLETTGGLNKKAPYVIRFQSSVSGLLPGSAVLFNGIRVGEVTTLRLLPERPREVEAVISIDANTPVRKDTGVSLDFQGLTGVPVIVMDGGSPAAQFPASDTPPVLNADPTAGQTMSAAARQVLGRLDRILGGNEESFHSLMDNLNAFSQALGRNSGRVDSILEGLERMIGGSKGAGGAYDLAALSAIPAAKPLSRQLGIPDPAALQAYDTEKLVIQKESGELLPSASAKLTDTLPKLLQARLIQSFENNGSLGQVVRYTEGMTVDYQLMLDIRRFQIVSGVSPTAEVELSAKLVTGEGHIEAARMFKASTPAKMADGAEAVSALDIAFAKAAEGLIIWVTGTIPSARVEKTPPEDVLARGRSKRSEKTR
jgi:phospholipid/cholesterol/gamma-HCH transport system substrate-binding protein